MSLFIAFLPVQGIEISKTDHIGSYFNDYSDGDQSSEKLAVEEIGKLEGLAVVNHPGRYRKKRNAEFYSDLYQTFDYLVGMEVDTKGDLYPDDRILYSHFLCLTGLYGLFQMMIFTGSNILDPVIMPVNPPMGESLKAGLERMPI